MYSVVYSFWWYSNTDWLSRPFLSYCLCHCVISGLRYVSSVHIRYKVKVVSVFKELKFCNAGNTEVW